MISVHIAIPKYELSAVVRMVVDTAADRTLWIPMPHVRSGMDLGTPDTVILGLGGGIEAHEEMALLSMLDEDENRLFVFELSILMPAGQMDEDIPSILGRDILNRTHVSFRPHEGGGGEYALEVVSTDLVIDLDNKPGTARPDALLGDPNLDLIAAVREDEA